MRPSRVLFSAALALAAGAFLPAALAACAGSDAPEGGSPPVVSVAEPSRAPPSRDEPLEEGSAEPEMPPELEATDDPRWGEGVDGGGAVLYVGDAGRFVASYARARAAGFSPAEIRAQVEPRALGRYPRLAELHMLRSACAELGDVACRARASELIPKAEERLRTTLAARRPALDGGAAPVLALPGDAGLRRDATP